MDVRVGFIMGPRAARRLVLRTAGVQDAIVESVAVGRRHCSVVRAPALYVDTGLIAFPLFATGVAPPMRM